MKIKKALIGFGTITLLYLIVLVWADSRNQVFSQIPALLNILPVLVSLSLLSYLIRYLRWFWLLKQTHYPCGFAIGFLAYLAGFAFTATPGKVGELVRIRYFQPQGIPPSVVLSAFIFERALDLIVVLLLAATFINRPDVFFVALSFVAGLLLTVTLVAARPRLLSKMAAWARFHGLKKIARLLTTFRQGFSGCRLWLNFRDTSLALALGISGWGLTSLAFVYLLQSLQIAAPFNAAFALYPLAMLAGAASMIPGGVGSTEVAIIVLLSSLDVNLANATLAAVGIRLASMWFSVVCGLGALSYLEIRNNKKIPSPQ